MDVIDVCEKELFIFRPCDFNIFLCICKHILYVSGDNNKGLVLVRNFTSVDVSTSEIIEVWVKKSYKRGVVNCQIENQYPRLSH